MDAKVCCRMLLIGLSGAGKTSFLNLIYNLEKLRLLQETFGLELFERCHDVALERAPLNPMESKTTGAKEYHLNCYI